MFRSPVQGPLPWLGIYWTIAETFDTANYWNSPGRFWHPPIPDPDLTRCRSPVQSPLPRLGLYWPIAANLDTAEDWNWLGSASPFNPLSSDNQNYHETYTTLPLGNPFSSDYTLNQASLLKDLTAIESNVFSKVDYITSWQNITTHAQDPPDVPRVMELFYSCLDYFSTKLSTWYSDPACEKAVQQILYRAHISLRDWGSAYGVLEGNLDGLPDEAGQVVEAILLFLSEISTILIRSENTLP